MGLGWVQDNYPWKASSWVWVCN